MITRLKALYSIYNFFQRKYLIHNLPVYKELGIKKKYYSPISSEDFKHLSEKRSDSDNETALHQRLKNSRAFHSQTLENQNSLLDFEKNGFAILKGFFSPETAEKVNQEVDSLFEKGIIKYKYRNKFMFAFHHSQIIEAMGEDKTLKELLQNLLNRQPVLFQSINFLHGSEQATHSDSIHMTTYPYGGLIAVWIALEDIHLDNGPLHYYPQSHKLPYYLNSEYGNNGSKWMIGDKTYTEYENMIKEKIKSMPLEKRVFEAKKGDVFIWHANLFHGGEVHTNKEKTRKSMVFHYFSKGVICYHEITQRPAIIKR